VPIRTSDIPLPMRVSDRIAPMVWAALLKCAMKLPIHLCLWALELEQLENNLDALNTRLSPDQIKRLDDISRGEMGFPHAVLANPATKQFISGGVEVHRKRHLQQ
jgi:hypothetical protein